MAKDPALSDFAAWAAELRRRVERAEAKETQSETMAPAETSHGILRLACYRYLRKLKQQGLIENLKAYVEGRDPGRWHRHPGVDADWVMRLMERAEGRQWLTPPRRARIVLELSLADKWGVKSRWLLPFLYECGNQSIIETLFETDELPRWLEKYRTAPSTKRRKVVSE